MQDESLLALVDGRKNGLSLNWFLCSSAHRTTPTKWSRIANFWEHKVPCDLLHNATCHCQRGL